MIPIKDDIISLECFEVQNKIHSKNSSKFYQIMNVNNGEKKFAKISCKIDDISRDALIDFSREVSIISRINFPSIFKFLGYSLANFKNKPKPVIVTDYYSSFTLYELISQKEEIDLTFLSKWNDTTKLICIYGIASAISFLHSHNIIHRGIDIENIYFDDKLYPKLFGFNASIEQLNGKSFNESQIKGSLRYLSPEILSDLQYSKSSDVYAFAIVMYEIDSNSIPFNEYESINSLINKVLKEGQRPPIDIVSIRKPFQDLIKKCWSEKPEERPTIDDIINDLKNNRNYITENVNEAEFSAYIKYIEEFPSEFLNSKQHLELDEVIKSKSHTFHKENIKINLRGPLYDGSYIDINKYYLRDVCTENKGYKVYNIRRKEEEEITIEQKIQLLLTESEEEQEKILNSIYEKCFHAEVYSKEINDFYQNEIVNYSRKLGILSQINHPAILNFVGYSPIDFDNKNKPLILRENSTYAIEDLYEISFHEKLIYIYGIASAMSYLHSHNIIHRDLKPSNILIDIEKLPKLTGFDISFELSTDLIKKSKRIKGTPAYLAPEIYLNHEYSKASDVYAFGLTVYKILTGEKPFKEFNNPNDIKRMICDEKKRPSFEIPICKAYRNLIERCWSQNVKERPTFDDILHELKTNSDFITEEVDKEDYFEYIEFLDEFPTTFDSSKRIDHYDDAVIHNLHTFKEIKPYPGLKSMYETELNDLSFDYEFFDIDKYSSLQIHTGYFYKIDKLYNTETEEVYVKKYPNSELDNFTKSEIKNFIREIKIISQLNHPSIIKYIGYNPNVGCNNVPAIIVEFSPHGTIDEFNEANSNKAQDENKENKQLDWNDTKKLIYLYGVASGMAYLHLHNIIHRDLKSGNILLDDSLCPKISGFNISKEIYNNLSAKSYKLKGTPAYLAPEVYLNKEYSKSSDVYSFGLIVYEIITGEKPFKKTFSAKVIKQTICDKGERPKIPENVNEAYRSLIERCWSQQPKSRPSFESITNELKTNPLFITDSIDKEEYFNYIKKIDESTISFDSSKQVAHFGQIIKSKVIKSYYEKNNKINLGSIYETETDNILLNHDFINIQNYEKKKLFCSLYSFKLYEIVNKQNGEICRAKKAKENDSYTKYTLDKELNIIIENNHPSFLRFIGFSPFDFKNRSLPTLITDIGINGTLESIFDLDIKNPNQLTLDATKRLINIYGIASGMAYLHSHDTIHRDLKPANILLDEFLFPRISGFNESQSLSKNPIPNFAEQSFGFKLIKDNIYVSPESYVFCVECSASDVYAFAMIAYQLITNEKPFEDIGFEVIHQIYYNNLRPEFNESVPECYQSLIKKCWSVDPNDRPKFDEIVYHLKTNPDFITEFVNKDEFESYVNYINEAQSSNNYFQTDFIKSKNQNFRKVELDMKKIRNPTRLNFSVNMGSTNLDGFEKISKIGSGSFGVVYKVLEKETNNFCAAKISIYEIDQCQNDSIINLSREIEIISKLNHPSILQFIGFSPKNFKNKPKPIIITELASNYSLDVIIEDERNGLANDDWNDTKKLINIYGIASGMAYLHKLDIIHRDLKPANILLDEFLYPKIADFGLSKTLYEEDKNEDSFKYAITSGFKGTYAYCAPEIIENQIYTKSGDVYAFGMIVYELMTNENPFQSFNQYRLMKELLNGYRPKFNFPIPYCYRKLIEKCWSNNYRSRPQFSNIVELIETDPSFITPNIDKEEFLNYVELIKENDQTLSSSFRSTKKPKISLKVFDDIGKETKKDDHSITSNIGPKIGLKITDDDKMHISKVDPTKKSLIGSKVVEEEEETSKDAAFINLNKYERKEIISKSDQSKLCKFIEIETGQFYAGQMSMMKINQIPKSEVGQLSIELDKISKLKHPSLLKFIGYSPVDFKKQKKPVIITEYFKNVSLSNILEIERIKKPIQGWNDTKKLINIYGIASGMSYLHSHGILHKSLKPCNIYLDEILTPKIGDFGLSTRFDSSENITVQSFSGVKASPIYSSPEVLLNDEYSKSSDVYAFAFVVYEIVTNELPFCEIRNNNNQIFTEVVIKQARPELKESVPESYKKLIEKCWSHDPNERPSFDEIVYWLKMDNKFIIDNVDSEDYQKYIDFIESKTQHLQKVDENYEAEEVKIKEVSNNDCNENANNDNNVNNDSNSNNDSNVSNDSNDNNDNNANNDSNAILLTTSDDELEKMSTETLQLLGQKFIQENDSENIYRVLSRLIKLGKYEIPLDYALMLYKLQYYHQSFNYFSLISSTNNPIAKYFIGVMEFSGLGCKENRDESYQILKYLSDNGIDEATKFISEHFPNK